MNLCSNNHDEICHDSRNCPLCALREEKDSEIAALTDRVDELAKIREEQDGEIATLTSKVDELSGELDRRGE